MKPFINCEWTYGQKGQAPKFDPIYAIPQEVREQVPVIYIGADRNLQDQLPSARHSLLRRMFEEIDRKLRNPAEVIVRKAADGTETKVHRLTEFREMMAAAIDLLRTKDFQELETAIKRNALEQLGLDAATDDVDLYFTPLDAMDFYKCLELVIREGDFSISAGRMGHGMQNAIVIAILRAFEETQKRGAIILIEEPEICLHPTMQRSLFGTLRRLGETNQVIYTTHSPHFVSVPDYCDVILVRRSPKDGTSVTRSELPTEPWRVEKLRQAVDRERGELFFARRLLLVEGDTEKLAMPEHAAKLTIDLDRHGAAIVEVGGKRNLLDFAELALSFGVPTGIVYDRDSSDFDDEKAETEYNDKLDALDNGDTVRVWQLDKDYEDVLKREIGEALYNRMLEKYPKAEFGPGKPRRQRMIAADAEVPVPGRLEEILRWLAG